LTSGDYDHGTWSDGYFDGLRAADADWQVDESELYHLEPDGTIAQVTTRRGPDHDPLVAGDELYWLGHDHTGSTHDITRVYARHLPNGDVRCLTPGLDRSIARMVPARLGQGVLCQYEDQGAIRCARLLPDGTFTPLTPGDVQFAIGDESNHGTLVGVLQSPQQPPQIALRSDDGSFRVLTHVNRDLLHGRTLGKVEPMTWKGADGWDVQGWLVLPPDFDGSKKYPLMLQIHGGPHSMFGVNFDFERQNHAANGYLLLYTNPRGSTGYGERFARGIQNAYPGKDYDDLMAGVDAVIARGCVDTDNLFVYGGSGGGVLTAWTVGMTRRFRAAVSMFPVIDWISFVGTTDGPFWYTNFKQLPWDDISEHWQRSPLRLVGNVTTPVMLITGELDLRTPISQTEEYYQALKLRKIDTVLVRMQDEYHGASARHPSNRMRRILYVRTWFEQHKAKAGAK
jgi:dipeptidyl aminopeptidase/acylaminoacyl peptidase